MPFQSRFHRIGELHREVMIGEEGAPVHDTTEATIRT